TRTVRKIQLKSLRNLQSYKTADKNAQPNKKVPHSHFFLSGTACPGPGRCGSTGCLGFGGSSGKEFQR
ncbi:hypothetical protein, partial [Tardiphaga sp. P5_C10]